MSTSGTSTIIMVLITLSAALSLLAWWFSVQTSRCTRALLAHLEQNQQSYWHSDLRRSRSHHPVGVIEAYRRSNRSNDPDFDCLYQARANAMRAQIATICLAMALIGLVLVGTRYWGWTW
jgi:hypothetical protein